MNSRFDPVRPGRSVAVDTAAVAFEDGLPDAVRRAIEACPKAGCARRGYAVRGKITVEAQANWLTGGLEVRAAALTKRIGQVTRLGARRKRARVLTGT